MRKNIIVAALAYFLSSAAFANTDEIKFGEYESPAAAHFSDIVISDWAGDILMKGLARYGTLLLEFDAELKLVEDRYSGRGKIRISYTNNLSCAYPVRVIAKARGNDLYLKVNAPTSVYTSIPANLFICPEVPGYDTVTDKDPYTLIVDEE